MIRIGIAAIALLTLGAAAPKQVERPEITGISHMAVYASDMAAADRFYGFVLGGRKGTDPENAAGVRYYFSPVQYVEVLPLPAGQGMSRMAHVAYNTRDASGLRAYLKARGVQGVGELTKRSDGSIAFTTQDPEANQVEFVQPAALDAQAVPSAISGRIIHVGYLVRDRAKEDRFYREILGFRPYWYGAMKEGSVDWVSQQTPDGRDWLEYMMVGDGSTVPESRVDANQLGVLNHFSLGVVNMQAAVTKMIVEDRLSPRHDGPQMGRDGKWQANFYDPDGTRVELMEFQPVAKPCCSAFTAESPAS